MKDDLKASLEDPNPGPDASAGIESSGEACPNLSVAVVSYNTRELLRACLMSLLARQNEGEANLEIIVADNGSADGSLEMIRAEFPTVRLIETGGNLGFGRANNLALRNARGRFFCLLNSDAEVLPDALAQTLTYMDAHPDVGLVGGQLLWPDGRPQTSWGPDPTLTGVFEEQTFWGAVATYLGRLRSSPSSFADSCLPLGTAGTASEGPGEISFRDVDQITGAYMVIRREAWRQIGGFDPAYFMYNEDVDLNVRLRRAGWRVVFLPDVHITHHLGASSRADWQTRARMVSANNQSRYYYFTRYGGPAAGAKLKALCLLGASIRLVGWSLLVFIKPSARDKVKLFREVWRQTMAMAVSE